MSNPRPAPSCAFFFNDPATTEIYPLSLHDALPIWLACAAPVRAASPGTPVALTPQQYSQHFRHLDSGAGVPMRGRLVPAPARLGEAITYRGTVLVTPSVRVHFEPPASAGALTWSHLHAGRLRPNWFTGPASLDTVWFEAQLQVFETGPVAVPGPVVQLSTLPGTTRPGTTRLPTARVVVIPTLTAADSNAELRALHGPVAAPWWERVPWSTIVAGVMMVTALVLLPPPAPPREREAPRAGGAGE